jgi:hypothetical protein
VSDTPRMKPLYERMDWIGGTAFVGVILLVVGLVTRFNTKWLDHMDVAGAGLIITGQAVAWAVRLWRQRARRAAPSPPV